MSSILNKGPYGMFKTLGEHMQEIGFLIADPITPGDVWMVMTGKRLKQIIRTKKTWQKRYDMSQIPEIQNLDPKDVPNDYFIVNDGAHRIVYYGPDADRAMGLMKVKFFTM